MKLFFDSSAFAKRFVEEAGSQEVEALCLDADALCLSVICAPELISAFNRRLREQSIDRREYAAVKERLFQDLRDATIVNLTPEVIQASMKVLEASPVRTMDALHIACALTCKADLFASSDQRQIEAAKVMGMKILLV